MIIDEEENLRASPDPQSMQLSEFLLRIVISMRFISSSKSAGRLPVVRDHS